MKYHQFIFGLLASLLLSLLVCRSAASQERATSREGEVLYNGIRLPAVWPPKAASLPDPMPAPYYLSNPPSVIPIEVGRQLFVDDFLIASTTLVRTFYKATYHPLNPVLRPDKPWETGPVTNFSAGANGEVIASAFLFDGGVWFDPKDNLFKMFYVVIGRYLCLATSTDGIHWIKPDLDVRRGTNIVRVCEFNEDTSDVWLDHAETDPARRFKCFVDVAVPKPAVYAEHTHKAYFSPDGIHWTKGWSHPGYRDGVNIFYNPFRKVWVLGMRGTGMVWSKGVGKGPVTTVRDRRYHEGEDFLTALDWGTKPSVERAGGTDHSVPWLRADSLDEHVAGRWDANNVLPGLYSLQVNAYESLMLGGFGIIPGYWPDGSTKLNFGSLGYSRDGFTFYRPNREEILPHGNYGDWNSGYIHPSAGVCLVVGDNLYFYVGARQVVTNSPTITRKYNSGLAILRRDGFASMDATKQGGTLTTRPVRFDGKYLFVNVDARQGELRVEALDAAGKPQAPFTKDNCVPIRVDKTLAKVSWQGTDELSTLAGRPICFRFYLTSGKLFAFWVSPDASGASHGYVGAGGPGFTGPTDTVGARTEKATYQGTRLDD